MVLYRQRFDYFIMGVRGNNKATYLVYEEIQHLRVDVDAPPVAIYKRIDTELNKEVENKTYQVIIPVLIIRMESGNL